MCIFNQSTAAKSDFELDWMLLHDGRFSQVYLVAFSLGWMVFRHIDFDARLHFASELWCKWFEKIDRNHGRSIASSTSLRLCIISVMKMRTPLIEIIWSFLINKPLNMLMPIKIEHNTNFQSKKRKNPCLTSVKSDSASCVRVLSTHRADRCMPISTYKLLFCKQSSRDVHHTRLHNAHTGTCMHRLTHKTQLTLPQYAFLYIECVKGSHSGKNLRELSKKRVSKTQILNVCISIYISYFILHRVHLLFYCALCKIISLLFSILLNVDVVSRAAHEYTTTIYLSYAPINAF